MDSIEGMRDFRDAHPDSTWDYFVEWKFLGQVVGKSEGRGFASHREASDMVLWTLENRPFKWLLWLRVKVTFEARDPE